MSWNTHSPINRNYRLQAGPRKARGGERRRQRTQDRNKIASARIQNKWETDLKFSREITFVISNSERLIVLITTISVPVGGGGPQHPSSLLPSHLTREAFFFLNCSAWTSWPKRPEIISSTQTWPQRTKIISSKQRTWSSQLKVHACVLCDAGFRDSVPAMSAFGSKAVDRKVVQWVRSDLGVRNAPATFIAGSESVLKPEQIVCHLFKGKRWFLNRPGRAWTRELWNHGDHQACTFEGDSKIMPRMFTGGRWKFNCCTGTLGSQRFWSQQEVAQVWQQD